MRAYLKGLPEEISGLIQAVKDISHRCGYRAYLVGGFVRDLILGVGNLDVDITVEGDGIKLAGLLAKSLKAKFIRYHRFGTATVIIGNKFKVDIASARKEIYPEPAALPIVKNGRIGDDLARRDFSINAMAIDITRNLGELVDLFNGQGDLKHKKIRVLHPLSFIDDPTRILRAVRFEQRFGFKIEAATLGYLKEAADLKMLEKVGPQRLRDELILMLCEDRPERGIRRLQNLYGLKFLNANLAVTKEELKLFNQIGREVVWFKKSCPRRRKLDVWLIYFLGLIDRLKIVDAKLILSKLMLRKGEEKRILEYKKNNRKISASLMAKKIKPGDIFRILEPLSYEVIVMLRAKNNSLVLKRHIADFLNKYNGVRLNISGHDLKNLGILPGPHYQKIFRKVLGAKLNGLANTKEHELGLAKRFKK